MPGAAPAATHGQHGFHPGSVNIAMTSAARSAIGAGQRATAIEEVRATLRDQAQRGQRILDDVDVDRLPRRAGRVDQSDDVAGDEPRREERSGAGRNAAGWRLAAAGRRRERRDRSAGGEADERAP